MLKGIHRVLKKNGRFLLQMGGRGNAADMVKSVEKVMIKKGWRRYFTDFEFPYSFYEPVEYTRLLKEAGLIADRVELIPKDMIHSGQDKLAGWFRTTWQPYTERLPAMHRDEFIQDVITTYLQQHPPEKDGKTHVYMVRLEVEGHKN